MEKEQVIDVLFTFVDGTTVFYKAADEFEFNNSEGGDGIYVVQRGKEIWSHPARHVQGTWGKAYDKED